MPEQQESGRNGDQQAQALSLAAWGQQGPRGQSTAH